MDMLEMRPVVVKAFVAGFEQAVVRFASVESYGEFLPHLIIEIILVRTNPPLNENLFLLRYRPLVPAGILCRVARQIGNGFLVDEADVFAHVHALGRRDAAKLGFREVGMQRDSVNHANAQKFRGFPQSLDRTPDVHLERPDYIADFLALWIRYLALHLRDRGGLRRGVYRRLLGIGAARRAHLLLAFPLQSALRALPGAFGDLYLHIFKDRLRDESVSWINGIIDIPEGVSKETKVSGFACADCIVADIFLGYVECSPSRFRNALRLRIRRGRLSDKFRCGLHVHGCAIADIAPVVVGSEPILRGIYPDGIKGKADVRKNRIMVPREEQMVAEPLAVQLQLLVLNHVVALVQQPLDAFLDGPAERVRWDQ